LIPFLTKHPENNGQKIEAAKDYHNFSSCQEKWSLSLFSPSFCFSAPPFRRPPHSWGGSAALIFPVSNITLLIFYKGQSLRKRAGLILWLAWKSWLYGAIKGRFPDGLSSGKQFSPFGSQGG
jgi:hypothetical protein